MLLLNPILRYSWLRAGIRIIKRTRHTNNICAFFMNYIVKAKVLSNLYLLSNEDDDLLNHNFERWIRYQSVLQGALHKGNLNDFNIVGESVWPSECRYFVSAHVGIYPTLILHLSKRFPDKVIVCLIGKQKAMDLIVNVASEHKVNVKFVEIGNSPFALRECIKLAKSGAVFLSFVDVPLGTSNNDLLEVNFAKGKAKFKSGIFRLAETLNLEPYMIISMYDPEGYDVNIVTYPVLDYQYFFAKLNDIICGKPYVWDKVMDMHRFYEARDTGAYIGFRVGGDNYLMCALSKRTYKVNKPLFDEFTKLTDGPLTDGASCRIKKRISSETGINIRKAIQFTI